MTPEVAPEVAEEVEEEEAEFLVELPESITFAEGELTIFDPAEFAEKTGALAVQVVGGDVLLMLHDLKMHRVEIVKGVAPKGTVRSITAKKPETQ